MSDHKPIFLKTPINSKISYKKEQTKYIIDWVKATENDIVNYKNLLNYYFTYFHLSHSVITCNNFLCNTHDTYILEKLDEFIDIINYCAYATIPIKTIKSKGGVPGWNQFVQPFKDKSIFFNDIWKNAGSPPTGPLAQNKKNGMI